MSRLLPALAVLAACSSTAPKELHTTTHTGAASRDTSTDTAGACTEEKGVLSGTVSLDWTPPETSSVHVLVSDGGELPIELLVDSTHQWSVELAAGPWSVWAEVENCRSTPVELVVEVCAEVVQDLSLSELDCMVGLVPSHQVFQAR